MPGPKHLATATRRSGREKAVLVVGGVLTMALLLGASAVGYLNARFGQIRRFDVAIDAAPASGEPRNYLLVGTDSREGLDEDDPANAVFLGDGQEGTESLRTDTIMVLRVDPDDGDASLLSFPRDLWVEIADTGEMNRINVAFSHGREVLMDTIRENFGIPIHHYVELDFVGFLGLVETIGGVPMYFETPVRDTESGLDIESPGCVTLEPRQALSFARARHLDYQDPDTGRWRTDQSGDLGRISRQQEFIRRAISKAVGRGLSNPVALNRLVDVGVDYVGLDPTLDVSEIVSLGRRFASFDAENLETYSVPASSFRTSAGASVLDLDERDAEPILNVFRGIDPDTLTPGLVEVTVLNGNGLDGFAGDVSAALETIGFATDEPGDSADHFVDSTLYYAPGSEQAATRVARHLSSDVEFAVDDELGEDEVVLVAGEDFTTVHDQPSPEVPELPTTTTTEADGSTSSPTSTTSTTTTSVVGYVPNAAASCV
ncbi:MAG: LCP family protein [Acidimicrobiales bacterium]|nr:LCP family protein [Acidimicrobiales bacterium]